MNTANCCRTCLSDQNLHPMFLLPEYSEKYSSAVFLVTGVKVEINDSLPQSMCSNCITFINKCLKFRKKCELIQKVLHENQVNVKEEYLELKTEENSTSIDITEYLEEDFKDFDDNLTLATLQCNDLDNDNINDVVGFNGKKRRRTKGSEKKKENEKECIECEYCHKILTSKLSLRNHYKIHTGFDVVCEHCGKKFITRRLLLMHCRAKHGYEKTDKCSYCDYKASNAEQVKIHERLHTGEKPFVCKECGAGFHRKSSYLQHVAIHLPEKTVQCEQCPARFKSVTLMRIHKNRHRPSRYTFKCDLCDNSFARRRNVARHLQRVHGLQHPPEAYIHRITIH